MDIQLLMAWRPILEGMLGHADLEERALAENEWFTATMVQTAIGAMLPWFEGDALAELRGRYPATTTERRIGLILAGNLPLVGLHDVLMVLLSGHRAVVKPSHKDRVLLQHLVAHSPAALQARITLVDALAPQAIDYLIATGSNTSAQQIAAYYKGIPLLTRQNRYSVAVLRSSMPAAAWTGLAQDILLYHGMGCRSVSSILVPQGYDLAPLADAIDALDPLGFAACWADVLRYERATQQVLGRSEPICAHIVVARSTALRPGKIGILHVVDYASEDDIPQLLAAIAPDLQCIVGQGYLPFGQAQFPAVDDFADGVDTLEVLMHL